VCILSRTLWDRSTLPTYLKLRGTFATLLFCVLPLPMYLAVSKVVLSQGPSVEILVGQVSNRLTDNRTDWIQPRQRFHLDLEKKIHSKCF